MLDLFFADLGEREEKARGGDLCQSRNGLRVRIHQHGAVYSPKALLEKMFNEKGDNLDYFVICQETKYLGA
jgi:carboxypeptidase Taq